MNSKQIDRARLALKHAGAPTERKSRVATLVAQLENDVDRLGQQKDSVRADYRRQLERWRTEEVPENTPVTAIPSDAQDSRLYRLTAVFALLAEMGLAAWIFFRLGVPWWIGALTAVFVTVVLHGAFLQVVCDAERPKASVWRMRRLVSLPSLIGFLIAVALATLARYAHGSLAVWLVPFFGVSLWLATISLTLMAASLLTLAHLLAWSFRDERVYRELENEERASADLLRELREEDGAMTPRTRIPLAALPAGPQDIGRQATVHMILLLALAVASSTACSMPSTSADVVPVRSVTESSMGSESGPSFHVYIDWSGSPVREALEEAWENLRAELPTIIEAHNIHHLTLWRFDEDGWSPQRIENLALPALALPTRTETSAGEWDSFSNLRDAMREAEEHNKRVKRDAALGPYRMALAESLKTLDSLTILPEKNRKSRRTDVVGLLRRIALQREPGTRFAIVLTDLIDSRHRELPRLGPPEGDVRALILHVPASPKDAAFAFGRALPASEQFDQRSRELQEKMPWARVVPHFTRDLAGLFRRPGTDPGAGSSTLVQSSRY